MTEDRRQMTEDRRQTHTDKRKAQSTLEFTVALIAVVILLLGSVKIFVWMNERMVLRQEAYEDSRVPAGSDEPGVQVDETDFPALDIFGEVSLEKIQTNTDGHR